MNIRPSLDHKRARGYYSSSRSTSVLIVVVASLVALSGCGDTGSGAEFSDRAADICIRANDDVRTLGPEPPILTARQADWIESLTEIDSIAVRRLRRLEPLERDRGSIVEMLSAFERGLSYGDDIARASRMGNDAEFRAAVFAALEWLDKARAIAADHGLDACAQLGSVKRAT
jgi:hypothetical protein